MKLLRFSAALLVFMVAGVALGAGPYSYQGSGGPGDALILSYPNVTNSQTQTISFILNTGSAPLDGDMHFAFGGRGHPFSTYLYGRGIIIGNFSGATNGCNGIAVEDFTRNTFSAGIIPGTCVPFSLQPYTTYKIEMSLTYGDVSYQVYVREYVDTIPPRYVWLRVRNGGCTKTAGVSCPEYTPIDADYGNVFAAAAFLNAGYSWSISNMYVGHN